MGSRLINQLSGRFVTTGLPLANMTLRYTSYMICTTPRSGSTLLCKLLSATNIAGNPESHFHTPSLERWLEFYDIGSDNNRTHQDTLIKVFDAARRFGSGKTNVFGLRMQMGSFEFFLGQLSLCRPDCHNDIERFQAIFGPTLFIHLARPDKLEQAISRLKAEQSGLWHRASDGTELERLSPGQTLAYDAFKITQHIDDLTRLDQAWKSWFKTSGVQPLRISYDELSADPQNTLARVLCALGVDSSVAESTAIPTSKLADEMSTDWANRYREEHR